MNPGDRRIEVPSGWLDRPKTGGTQLRYRCDIGDGVRDECHS